MSASVHPFRSLPPSPVGQRSAVPGEAVSSRDSSGTVSIPAGTMVLLKAMAAHDRVSVEQLVTELACGRAKSLGLSRLARAVLDYPSHTCEPSMERKGVPSGVLPLPQGPP
ncbi:hypothetical protein [Aliihoeflea sp. PC F10.4]